MVDFQSHPRDLDRRLIASAVFLLILEFFILFSDFHFLWRPVNATFSRSVLGVLKLNESNVMVRSPLQLAWQKASVGQKLLEGDEIATLDDSKATIRFIDDQEVTLGPNSLLVLRRYRPLENATFKLSLLQGTLLQDKSSISNQKRLEIEVGGQKLVPDGVTGFKIDDHRSALSGPIELKMKSHLFEGPAPTTPVEAIRMSNPDDKANFVNPDAVVFQWKKAASHATVPAILEVARDENFKQLVIRQEVSADQFKFRPQNKGVYFWRLNSKGETRSFHVQHELTQPKLQRPSIEDAGPATSHKLRAPVLKRPSIRYEDSKLWIRALNLVLNLIVPTAHAEESAESDKEDRHGQYRVKLNWYPVAAAHAYTLQIATDPKFAHIVAEKIIVEPNYSWRSNVPGFYYWRVGAVDADGDRGPFSEFMTFDIKAERNVPGDDSTYETFLKFDEYSSREHQFRFMVGGNFGKYQFHSSDLEVAPATIRYSESTYRQVQIEYVNRLSNYYSIMFMARTDAKVLTPSNFEGLPNQNSLHQNETIFSLSVERRHFMPHSYITYEGGLRMSFIDIPTRESSSQLTLTNYPFFGAFGLMGYNLPLALASELKLKLGPVIQYSSGSLRYGAISSQSLSKALTDIFTFGARIEQDYRYYTFASDQIGGKAHALFFRALGYIEFNF